MFGGWAVVLHYRDRAKAKRSELDVRVTRYSSQVQAIAQNIGRYPARDIEITGLAPGTRRDRMNPGELQPGQQTDAHELPLDTPADLKNVSVRWRDARPGYQTKSLPRVPVVNKYAD